MTRLFTCGLIAAVLLTGATLADPGVVDDLVANRMNKG